MPIRLSPRARSARSCTTGPGRRRVPGVARRRLARPRRTPGAAADAAGRVDLGDLGRRGAGSWSPRRACRATTWGGKPMGQDVEVGPAADLTPGEVRGAGRYAVGNADGDLFAVTRRCRHLGADLANGSIDRHACLVCPWHGARYDITTGCMTRGPRGVFAKIPGVDAGYCARTALWPRSGFTRLPPQHRRSVLNRDAAQRARQPRDPDSRACCTAVRTASQKVARTVRRGRGRPSDAARPRRVARTRSSGRRRFGSSLSRAGARPSERPRPR